MSPLEHRLVELAGDLELPATPELAGRVQAALVEIATRRRRRARRVVLALAVLVASATALLAASPGARSALRDLLGLGGVSLVRAPELPAPGAPPGYLPGRPVPLALARERVDYALRLPQRAPAPRRVLLDESVAGGAVSIAWCCDPELLLTQLPGSTTLDYVEKVVGPAARIERVEVRGRPAAWVEGAEHVVRFVDRDGAFHEARTRLSGNVLLWRDGDVTLRLEGSLGRGEAIALAETIR